MSFCFLYDVVSENYSVQNSPWGGGGSIASSRSIKFIEISLGLLSDSWGWSGGAMVLGKFPVPGRPTIWITVGQGPTALAVGARGGCLDIFTLIYPLFPLSPSLWETA